MNLPHAFNVELYNAVLENIQDVAPRLVLADWLDENGAEYLAEFIRIGCKESFSDRDLDRITKLVVPGFLPKDYQSIGVTPNGVTYRILAFMRLPVFDWLYAPKRLHDVPIAWNCSSEKPMGEQGEIELQPRSVFPMVRLPVYTMVIPYPIPGMMNFTGKPAEPRYITHHIGYTFWRGFPYAVTIPMQHFKNHGGAIYGNHPVGAWTLTGIAPIRVKKSNMPVDNFEVGGDGLKPELRADDDPDYVYQWATTTVIGTAFMEQFAEYSAVAIPANNAVLEGIIGDGAAALASQNQQIADMGAIPADGQDDIVDAVPHTVELVRGNHYLLGYIFRRMNLIQLSRTKEEQRKAGLYGYNSTMLVFDTKRQAETALTETLNSLADEFYNKGNYNGLRYKVQ